MRPPLSHGSAKNNNSQNIRRTIFYKQTVTISTGPHYINNRASITISQTPAGRPLARSGAAPTQSSTFFSLAATIDSQLDPSPRLQTLRTPLFTPSTVPQLTPQWMQPACLPTCLPACLPAASPAWPLMGICDESRGRF